MPQVTSNRSRRVERLSILASPDIVEAALFPFLVDLAGLLMAAGLSAPAMSQLLNLAFVDAAGRSSVLRNRRLNQSAIATKTGLTRVEVKRILRSSKNRTEPITRKPSRTGRVIDGWQQDPDFTDSRGAPRSLRLRNGPLSFPDLVKRYSGDMTPKSLLHELDQQGLVEVTRQSVRLRRKSRQPIAAHVIRKLLAALNPTLEAANAASGSPRGIDAVTFRVSLANPLARKLLKRHLKAEIPQFLDRANIAANALSGSHYKPKPKRAATTTISIISLDSQ